MVSQYLQKAYPCPATWYTAAGPCLLLQPCLSYSPSSLEHASNLLVSQIGHSVSHFHILFMLVSLRQMLFLYYNPLLPDFSIYNINRILLYPIFKCFIAPVPTLPTSSCPLPMLSYLSFSPNNISMFSEGAWLCMCALRLCVMTLHVLLLHPSLALPFPLKNS